MKRTIIATLVLCVSLPALALAEPSLDRAAALACDRAERVAAGFSGECNAGPVSRRVLSGDVAEYTFDVRLGSGPYDVITLHRVVRESAPFEPARSASNLFLLHGDIWGFRPAFLADPGHSLPVFLARNGVDVWGMDQRWTRVPTSESDFAALRDWGFDHDVRDLGWALSVVRGVRLHTGGGLGRMNLLGWSRGGMIGYAYVNAEAGMDESARQVAGFIPVDIYLKTDDPGLRDAACRRSAQRQAQRAAGTWQDSSGTMVQTIHTLASADPLGLSPIYPGLTNRQAALLVGEATFVIMVPNEVVPFYHFTAGRFAAMPTPGGLPVPNGLRYSPEETWMTVLAGASPYQPTAQLADAELVICGAEDVPWDDHLAQVNNPVLYVGGGGGFGEYGIYTTTRLGSADVTVHVVDLAPPDERLFDYGHADLFLGTDAQALVWQPILDWLRAR